MSESKRNSRWLPDLIQAFQAVGGTATFQQVYRWIQTNRRDLPSEWQSLVRATVYQHSSDSPVFKAGELNVFHRKARGLWALRHPSETIVGKADYDLFFEVLVETAESQPERFAGKGEEVRKYIEELVAAKKKRFGIG